MAATPDSSEFASASREIDALTARIWSLDEVPARPELEVSATLAQLRETRRSLTEQQALSRAYLDEALRRDLRLVAPAGAGPRTAGPADGVRRARRVGTSGAGVVDHLARVVEVGQESAAEIGLLERAPGHLNSTEAIELARDVI